VKTRLGGAHTTDLGVGARVGLRNARRQGPRTGHRATEYVAGFLRPLWQTRVVHRCIAVCEMVTYGDNLQARSEGLQTAANGATTGKESHCRDRGSAA
jgi:hypothetical protein